MATEVYLGEPPAHVKEWIKKHHKQDQFNFLYRGKDDIEWQEHVPTENDIQLVDGKVTIKATDFKQIDDFDDVREVKLPNKWNNNGSIVDVTSIGIEAFLICWKFVSVTIPDSITSIEDYAFDSCYSLASVMIPSSVTSIGNSAFQDCSGIQQAYFEDRTLDQVKAIPDASGNRRYSWGLAESVIIPGIVEDTVLYTTAASPSTWLSSSPEFDASTGTFSGFAEKADAVKVITPSKVNDIDVVSIGSSAFAFCKTLTSVLVGDRVTNINNRAFWGCSGLASMTIPGSVTSIGSWAFRGCSRMTVVEFEGNAPTTVGNEAFAGVASGCKAIISSTATGFPEEGQTWNGLVVEVKS